MNSWKPKQPPKFSGSIVISRKAWLNTKANLDRMWQGHLDHGARNNLFGKIIMLDMVKDGTLSEDMNYSWNDHVQYNLWKGYYRVAPAVTFEWLFDPTFY